MDFHTFDCKRFGKNYEPVLATFYHFRYFDNVRAVKFLKVFKQEGIFKLWSWKAFSESYDCASSIKIQVRYLISIIGKVKNFLSVVTTFTDKCHLKRNVDFMIMT